MQHSIDTEKAKKWGRHHKWCISCHAAYRGDAETRQNSMHRLDNIAPLTLFDVLLMHENQCNS